MSKFYITTSIPYLNAPPHVGHALEFVQADVIARYQRLLGKDIFFLTGTDEHGAKVARAAKQDKKEPKAFVDELAKKFQELVEKLNISNDNFIRTSDQKRHWPVARAIWQKLKSAGDIYKKNYKGLYCVGHEAFIKKSELKNGICPDHKTKPEIIEEENYFFRLTKYTKEIESKIKTGELKIIPPHRANETLELLKETEDVSVSRPAEDLSWGIPVQEDSEHTLYVWIDALSNYLSGIIKDTERLFDDEQFLKFWPADIHLVGKDILRFHAIIWPAILLSARLPLPNKIFVHGHITVENEKMSKSIGNVIDPFQLIKKYGVDPTRYFLLREIPSYEDGDFSYQKLEQRHQSDLVNNLGNLVNRAVVLHQKFLNGLSHFKQELVDKETQEKINLCWQRYHENLDKFKLHEALVNILELSSWGNKFIDFHKPWEVVKDNPEHFEQILNTTIFIIFNLAWLLKPFLPETSDKIFRQFHLNSEIILNEQEMTTDQAELLFSKI